MSRLVRIQKKRRECEELEGTYDIESDTCVGQQIDNNDLSAVQVFGVSFAITAGGLLVLLIGLRVIKYTRKLLILKGVDKLESKTSWRAIKVLYLTTATILFLVGLFMANPAAWFGIFLFAFYPYFKCANAYVYFGKNKTKDTDRERKLK